MSDYKPPYMPFFVRDFYGDFRVRAMTPRQRAMYRSLLDNAWIAQKPCHIPNSSDIWKMADADSRASWERNKEPILSMFTLSDDEQFYFKHRQMEEYERIVQQHTSCSEAGKRGVIAKKRKGGSGHPSAALKQGLSIQNQNQNHCFDATMIARAVVEETGLAGLGVLEAVQAQAALTLKDGASAEQTRETMIASWKRFQSERSNLEYAWGAPKFFSEGHWRSPDAWPWKQGAKPSAVQPKLLTLAEKRALEQAGGVQ